MPRMRRSVCFYNNPRAVVLEYEVSKAVGRTSVRDMNQYQPEEEKPKAALSTPAHRAVEDIKRQAGVLERFLHDLELQQADEERYADLRDKHAALITRNTEIEIWLDVIRTALKNHDNGELNARQFANEVDSAIKGWEGK